MSAPTIWTIGHSTHPLPEFIAMLQAPGVRELVDVRRHPGSRAQPAYNQDALRVALVASGIAYTHLVSLGGRRRASPDTHNTRWRNTSFRGYADHMEGAEFAQGLAELEAIATRRPSAFMCAEGPWWRCHRSLIADALKARGWRVLHIMGVGKFTEHPWTTAARIDDGHLSYRDDDVA